MFIFPKSYKIYIPSFCHIESSRDVTFYEDTAFNRSRKIQGEYIQEEEPIAPRTKPRKDAVCEDEVPYEPEMNDHDLDESPRPANLPHSERRKPAWAHEIIQDSKNYGAEGKREIKRP